MQNKAIGPNNPPGNLLSLRLLYRQDMASLIYSLLQVKRYAEQVLMWPFVWYGKNRVSKSGLTGEFDLVCLFPGYALGGAEKVHADIIACFPEKRVLVLFTRRSANDKMYHLFDLPHVTLLDISRFTDNKAKYWQNFIWRGICAGFINRHQKRPVVFSGQCNFGYKLLPHLDREVRKVELIHVAEKKFSWITFPFIGLIDRRIMISDIIIQRALDFYRQIGVPHKYDSRIQKIINQTPIPESIPVRIYNDPIKVYYAGRGGYPKRLYLLMEIIRRCQANQLPLSFHFAGSMEDEIPGDLRNSITYHGEIPGGEPMRALHRQMDILLMVSASEAFPMLIMEAMAHGALVVSTNVGGIPEHIHHGENGLLIEDSTEEEIIKNGVLILTELCTNREKLKRLAEASRSYAEKHFSEESFCNAYHQAFFNA